MRAAARPRRRLGEGGRTPPRQPALVLRLRLGRRADQRIQLGNNVRYFPSTLPNVRTDNLHLMDLGLYKNFSLPNRLKLQIRVEAINALNYTVLWNPNVDPRNARFGFINQDRNNPRDIQIGARFTC